MNYKVAGRKIANAREKKGLTQVEVAKKVKLHSNYYARIERGDARPRIETLEEICEALGLKFANILAS